MLAGRTERNVNSVHYFVDSHGNVLSYTDTKGNVVEYRYDAENNLVKTMDTACPPPPPIDGGEGGQREI